MRNDKSTGGMRAKALASLGVAGVAALVIACAPASDPGTTTTTSEAPTTTELSTTTTTELSTTTTEAPTTSTATVLSTSWDGTWSGTASEPGFGDYPVEMVLSDSEAGISGMVTYPTLNCSGTLTQVSQSASELVLTELISAGVTNCAAQGTWTLALDEDGQHLSGTYYSSQTVTAELERQP